MLSAYRGWSIRGRYRVRLSVRLSIPGFAGCHVRMFRGSLYHRSCQSKHFPVSLHCYPDMLPHVTLMLYEVQIALRPKPLRHQHRCFHHRLHPNPDAARMLLQISDNAEEIVDMMSSGEAPHEQRNTMTGQEVLFSHDVKPMTVFCTSGGDSR